jgi:hypothetical protein
LLEAICDTLAANGGMAQLAGAFQQADPQAVLAEYIRIFSQFWDSERLLSRRLRGLALIDPEFEQVVRARDQRRRKGARVLVQRLASGTGRPAPDAVEQASELVYTLTSFETFDSLAGSAHTCAEVAPLVQRLTRLALDM